MVQIKNEVRIPISDLFQRPGTSPIRLQDAWDRFHQEAQPGFCDTGHYRLSYYVWGEGPPLVFIPGLCDDALSFLLPIARLSRTFRCVAYDLPTGQGDGARLSRVHHDTLIADLLTLLDHLNLDRLPVLGSSFGSTVALAAAHRHPARFDRLILQGGFARRPLALAETFLAHFARYWPWNMANLPLRLEHLSLNHAEPFERQPPEVWQFYLQRSGAPPMAAVARRALLLHQLDLRPVLPFVEQPVLMICGQRDHLVGKVCEKELLDALPNVSRAEIEDCGHQPMFTHPEIFAEIVERFLGSACGLANPECNTSR